jgi:hypothetical protein
MPTKKTTKKAPRAKAKKGEKSVEAMTKAVDDVAVTANVFDILDEVRPEAKKATIKDVLGKIMIVTRMELRPGLGPGGQYASFHFHYRGDPTRREYYLNCGGVRIVPTVQGMIEKGVKTPINAKIEQVGKVYDFVR